MAVKGKITNRIKLHHAAYYAIRENAPSLGAQMACNAIHNVSKAYKTLIANRLEIKKQDWPLFRFGKSSSVHFDKRTYSLNNNNLSLFTLEGRIWVAFNPGAFQTQYLEHGIPKEAELVRKRKGWFFNLVLDLPDPEHVSAGNVLGVDMGRSFKNLSNTRRKLSAFKLYTSTRRIPPKLVLYAAMLALVPGIAFRVPFVAGLPTLTAMRLKT
ncbi:MAG: hypothetical protein FWH25_04075 [Syntrophorhabdaceae bacterium]|nr:hypothetical protein [Syntrophorhabdaceae bacterium]